MQCTQLTATNFSITQISINSILKAYCYILESAATSVCYAFASNVSATKWWASKMQLEHVQTVPPRLPLSLHNNHLQVIG